MKRNLLGLLAVVFAIAISSFTVSKNTIIYFQYDGSSAQDNVLSYTESQISPGEETTSPDVLAWISLESVNSILDDGEFAAAFEALDEEGDMSNSLDDDSERDEAFEFDNVSNLQAHLEKKEQP